MKTIETARAKIVELQSEMRASAQKLLEIRHELLNREAEARVEKMEKRVASARDKANQIEKLKSDGKGYAEIAELFGLSKARVRQLRSTAAGRFEGPPIHVTAESSIGALDFTERVSNVLRNMNGVELKTVGDLCQLSEGRLLKERNCGAVAVMEIKVKLRRAGLELKW